MDKIIILLLILSSLFIYRMSCEGFSNINPDENDSISFDVNDIISTTDKEDISIMKINEKKFHKKVYGITPYDIDQNYDKFILHSEISYCTPFYPECAPPNR